MNENLGIKEILDWYITAGVDEICGEVPFALAEPCLLYTSDAADD